MSVSPRQIIPPPHARQSLRLRLKPSESTVGYVDGAWWPRSLDLAVELPALVKVLAVRLGPVWRVMFALTSWDDAPRRINLDGHSIRLEGFRSQDENVISVVSMDRQRIHLLVIPPGADRAASHDAMMTAAGRDNADAPAVILTTAGIRPGTLIPDPRLTPDDVDMVPSRTS